MVPDCVVEEVGSPVVAVGVGGRAAGGGEEPDCQTVEGFVAGLGSCAR